MIKLIVIADSGNYLFWDAPLSGSAWDYVKIYKATAKSGTYSELTSGDGQAIATTSYFHGSGLSTDWYKIKAAYKATSYAETNVDGYQSLYSGSVTKAAQTFATSTALYTLDACKFYIKKSGSPTGNITATIYATSGGAPTGSALATSDTVDVTTLTTTAALQEFTFSTPYALAISTTYAICIEYSGGDASNYLQVGYDNSTPSHSGAGYNYTASWDVQTWDYSFYIFEYSEYSDETPAIVGYTTPDRIAKFLQVTTYSSSTVPTLQTVWNMILRASDEIDRYCGHAWREIFVYQEMYHLSTYYDIWSGQPIPLHHRKIRTLNANRADKVEVWGYLGDTYTDFLANYTEGRGSDYWLDYERGELWLYNRSIPRGVERIRMTYRYGDASVPYDIEQACVKMVAIELLQMERRAFSLPEGSSAPDSKYNIEKWQADIDKTLERRKELHFYLR